MQFIMQMYPELDYSLLASKKMHLWNLDKSLTGSVQHFHGAWQDETESMKALTIKVALWSKEQDSKYAAVALARPKAVRHCARILEV